MKLRSVRIALGVLLAAAVHPAIAQYDNASRAGPPPRQQTDDQARAAGAASPESNDVKPSQQA